MKWVRALLFLGFLWMFSFAQSYAQTPIRVGIAPHSSPRVLFESHVHVKMFLETYFKREVELVTAKSFHEFSKLTNEGNTYDVVITSSHLALLANMLASYRPLMGYTQGIGIVILARTKEVLKTAKRPLNVYAQGDISLSTLLAQEWLAAQGLEEGHGVRYHYEISASDTLALLLTRDDIDMVVMSSPNYQKLSDEQKQTLAVVYQSPSLPFNRTFAAKEGNGITLMQWEEALDAFALSAQGRAHLEITKLEGFKKLSFDALEGMKSIADISLKRLQGARP